MILPWRVDVPQDRWPWMNWLVIVACVVVAWLQLREALERPTHYPGIRTVPRTPADPNVSAALPRETAPRITETFMLNGWRLKGLFGYMWLHGGPLHLLGNMWFLWIFGNAVCAKVGNIRYLLLYVFFGIAAATAHLLTSSASAGGASGAIFGVVGMFLVLFYENRITCYFFFWFILPIIRQFSVSSVWMILFWVACNIFGVLSPTEASRTAYFAHLGGFAAGFTVAWVMCQRGWITMERYEKSLWQMWQEHRRARTEPALDPRYSRLEAEPVPEKPVPEDPVPMPAAPAKPVPFLDLDNGSVIPTDNLMCATCSCSETITVSRQYAGKVVRCPACKGKVRIPDSIPPARAHSLGANDGHIRFACSCGMKIKVPARYAGRSGKCPRCGSRVRIPQGS